MSVRIADLLSPPSKVLIREGVFLDVRPLELSEMLKLLITSRDVFLGVYSQFQSNMQDEEKLASILVAAPDFVAEVIGIASETVGQESDIRKLPASVQLIALKEIWTASVPDPKKLKALLFEVMAQLRKLPQNAEPGPDQTPPKPLDENLNVIFSA